TRRAAPSLCGGGIDSRAIVLKSRLSFLKPGGQGTVHVFCEHPSSIHKSAYDLKPKSLCKPERSPFHVGQNDLAIHRCAFLFSPPILNWRSFTRSVTNPAWPMRLPEKPLEELISVQRVSLRDTCHRCTTQESLLRDPPLPSSSVGGTSLRITPV